MFIEEYPGLVAPDLCERIVAYFESADHRPSVSVVNGVATVKKRRSGTMLEPAYLKSPGWQEIIAAVSPALMSSMNAYAAKFAGLAALARTDALTCTVPLVERVDPGQGFDWHFDQSASAPERVLAGLLYLRTITDGGSTDFWDQKHKIAPEAGKIVLFPPFWTHFHRGTPPGSQQKYVMSFFWVFARPPAA